MPLRWSTTAPLDPRPLKGQTTSGFLTEGHTVQPARAPQATGAETGVARRVRRAWVVVTALCLGCGTANPRVAVDVDGHTYRVVTLGSLTWLAENLRVTRTPAGAPLVTFAPEGNPDHVAVYGRLYPWDSARRACPAGWRLPSDEEWTALEDHLGSAPAPRLRETRYWPPGTSTAPDAVPFRARPAGYDNDQGFDSFFGSRAVFWTSTRQDEHFAWSRVILHDHDRLRRAPQHPQYGFSVRCVSDGDPGQPTSVEGRRRGALDRRRPFLPA